MISMVQDSIGPAFLSLCRALFEHVYQPVAALLILDVSVESWHLKLFDPDFGIEAACNACKPGSHVVMITNHPEGNMELSLVDERNIELLSNVASSVEAFIVCESECLMAT